MAMAQSLAVVRSTNTVCSSNPSGLSFLSLEPKESTRVQLKKTFRPERPHESESLTQNLPEGREGET